MGRRISPWCSAGWRGRRGRSVSPSSQAAVRFARRSPWPARPPPPRPPSRGAAPGIPPAAPRGSWARAVPRLPDNMASMALSSTSGAGAAAFGAGGREQVCLGGCESGHAAVYRIAGPLRNAAGFVWLSRKAEVRAKMVCWKQAVRQDIWRYRRKPDRPGLPPRAARHAPTGSRRACPVATRAVHVRAAR